MWKYIAPEVKEKIKYKQDVKKLETYKCDIYSLGMILLEIITPK